ncbi:unnamed protein product [Rotaria sordida]|uniref:Uncharacterized protein n=1 Tax=Rotaria sordida TaxID=392033 RepID=A0A819KYK7_9BILA|nr:unnamed protein product [Rotaria sordida]CAF1104959.1 unnamed protein product [Rotaria sordida]CAF3923679.1 unnamed protein product [Rotaria sordida]CAF3954038.1 unnamed protein product [Rotaria sordida]
MVIIHDNALHLAAYGGYKSVVEYLINQGANSLLLNKWCMTAEQEGFIYGKTIMNLFQSMREQNMFEVAANGIDWWFEYYFGNKSPNTINNDGINLLYVVCLHGPTSVAKWLLEREANINIKLSKESESTPLHGAVYHGHISTVDLLLSHGADINIKNKFEGNKYFSVHLYGDGKKSGNEPLAKLQLSCNATYNDLVHAMPDSIRNKYSNFSTARRPLNFDEDDTTVLSAVCRARYGKTKFIQLPLCITAHGKARYTHSGHILRNELPNYSMRDVHHKFASKCRSSSMKIRGPLTTNQTFTFEDFDLFNLSECICLFKTKYHNGNVKLNDMPTVSFTDEPNALLYNWVQPSSYWFSYRTRQTRSVSIRETHAFIHHTDMIPSLLRDVP